MLLFNDYGIPMSRPKQVRVDYAISVAKKLRQELRLGLYVDVEKLIRDENIRLKFCFDIEYSVTIRADGKYIMLIRPFIDYAVDRWTMAHEYAHIKLGHFDEFPLDVIYKGVHISLLTNQENYFLEREAHIFTERFLAPKDYVTKLVKYPITLTSVNMAKRQFGVSREAMINALDSYNLISKADFIQTFRCNVRPCALQRQ